MTDQTSIFDELDEKRIAPQPFALAIAMGIVYIALAYLSHFLGGVIDDVVSAASMSLGIYLLLQLKRYLQNFHSEKAIYWINRHLFISVAILLITVIDDLLRYLRREMLFEQGMYGAIIFSVSLVVCLAAAFVITIMFGISLRKVGNDFVGSLEKLGNAYAFCAPAAIGWLVATAIIHYDNQWTRLVYTTLALIPTVIILTVFNKARKYTNPKYQST